MVRTLLLNLSQRVPEGLGIVLTKIVTTAFTTSLETEAENPTPPTSSPSLGMILSQLHPAHIPTA